MCRCPAHGDRTPSLSVRLGRKRLLFHCFAGCDNGAVLQALHALRLPGTASWSPAERHDPPDDRSRRAAQKLWSEARVALGSPAELYLAMEELIAELASAMVGAELGLPVDHLDDHASYLASWLKVVKADNRAILTAAAKAEEASAFLLGFARVEHAPEALLAA